MTGMDKIVDAIIKWAVPAAGAALIAAWSNAQEDLRWVVLSVAAVILFGWYYSKTRTKTLLELSKRVDEIDRRQQVSEEDMGTTRKAFRAMLDDDMGKLYHACLRQGYTTEDERRRYDRLQKAYEANEGNGEAKRRKDLFYEILTEEQYRIRNGDAL